MGSGWTVTSLSGYRDYETCSAPTATTRARSRCCRATTRRRAPTRSRRSARRRKRSRCSPTRTATTSAACQPSSASPALRTAACAARGLLLLRLRGRRQRPDLRESRNGSADYTESVTDEAFFGLVAFDITDALTFDRRGPLHGGDEGAQRILLDRGLDGRLQPLDQQLYELGYAGHAPILPGNPRFYKPSARHRAVQREADFDSTTPRVTLDWQVTDNAMVMRFTRRAPNRAA